MHACVIVLGLTNTPKKYAIATWKAHHTNTDLGLPTIPPFNK